MFPMKLSLYSKISTIVSITALVALLLGHFVHAIEDSDLYILSNEELENTRGMTALYNLINTDCGGDGDSNTCSSLNCDTVTITMDTPYVKRELDCDGVEVVTDGRIYCEYTYSDRSVSRINGLCTNSSNPCDESFTGTCASCTGGTSRPTSGSSVYSWKAAN